MLPPIDSHEFLRVTESPLRQGNAAALAEAVAQRWRPQQLCPLLNHPQTDVRRVAAITLGLVGDRGVTACLAHALHDPDEQVNQMAEHGLWSIWFRSGAPQAVPAFRAGVQLLAQEAYQPAIQKFETARQIAPDFAEAFNQCAIAHFFQSHWQASLDDCRRTVRLVPQHFGAIAGMGHCFAQMGDFWQALECYRRALKVNPRMPAISQAAANIEARLHDVNDSSGEFLVDEIMR